MFGRAKSIAHLGLPIIIAQIGVVVQGFADTIMVGQYGTPELSAAGFVNNIFNLIIFFLLGLSYSTTPVTGAFWGSKRYDDAQRTLSESILVSLMGSAVVIMLLLALYLNIEVLHQPAELLPLIKPYFLILTASLPFVAVFNSYKQYTEATGDTKTPMLIMLGSNVLNISLNYVFIFTLDMGLMGAGVATLIARIMLIAPLTMKNRVYPTPSLAGISTLTKMGLPISFQLCLEASSFNICAIFMGWISATALAGHQILCTISQVVFLMHYGIGAAAAILIAQQLGKNDWQEIRRTAFTAYGMSICIGVIICGALIIIQKPLIMAFSTDAGVVAMALALFVPFMAYQFGDCTQIIFSNCLRGIGKVKTMLMDATIAYIVVSIPLSYVFGFILKQGAVGVWWGMPFGLTIAGIIFATRFLRNTNKKST